jgi:hypothetical protein
MKYRVVTLATLLLWVSVSCSGCYVVRWFGRVMSATGKGMVEATEEAQQKRKIERAENRSERALQRAEKQQQLQLYKQKADIKRSINESEK